MNKTKKAVGIILRVGLGLVLLALIYLAIRVRPPDQTVSPALQGVYPAPGQTDEGDASMMAETDIPYPAPGEEATQIAENEKQKPPLCVFSTGNSEEQAPNESPANFQFSEPKIILSNNVGIGIAEWLPDGEQLLIAENTENGSQIIKAINVHTGEATIFGERNGTGGKPIWLENQDAVAFVTIEQDHTELWISHRDQEDIQRIATGVSGWSLAGNEFGLVYFTTETGDIPQEWLSNSQSIREAAVDLARLEYKESVGSTISLVPGRTFATALQPHGNSMAFYGNDYFFIVDETGYTCEVDLGSLDGKPISVLHAKWSDDGRKIAMITTARNPGQIITFSSLMILDTTSGKITQPSIPVPIIYDVSWDADNRHLAILGADEDEFAKGRSSSRLYIVDSLNPEITILASNKLFGGGADEGWQVAWATNGEKIAVKCPDWSEEKPLIIMDHICLMDVVEAK